MLKRRCNADIVFARVSAKNCFNDHKCLLLDQIMINISLVHSHLSGSFILFIIRFTHCEFRSGNSAHMRSVFNCFFGNLCFHQSLLTNKCFNIVEILCKAA